MFIQTLPRRKTAAKIVIDDYQNFYEFGDSGGGFTDDTASASNLVSSNATQVTDPVQGEVASLTASPINQGFTNMGVVTGAVDKSISMIFAPSALFGQNIMTKLGDDLTFINFPSANTVRIRVGATTNNFIVSPFINLNTFRSLIITMTSALEARVYLNGIESSSGALTFTAPLELDTIGNYGFGTANDYLGLIGKVRVFPRLLIASQRVLIVTTDLKVP